MPDSDKTKYKERAVCLSKWSFWLTVTAWIVAAVFIILLGARDNAAVFQKRVSEEYMIVEDDICQEIPDADAPAGIRKEYTFTLDETIAADTTLAFYTVHQYVEVWLDGELVFRLMPPDDHRMSKTVGSNWVMIPICREDAGKTVRAEITPVYASFRDREIDFLIGSALAIYKDRLSKDLPQLILGMMAVFVGVVYICVSGYHMYKKRRGKNFLALGMFSVMMGFWRLTDTRFTPFILMEKPVFLFYVSVLMLVLGMVPFMKWIEGYFDRRHRWILDCYCICAVSFSLIQLMLQFLHVFDLRETLFVSHILIVIGGILAISIVINERVKYREKSRIPLGSRLPYICLAGVIADVAAFYIKGNSSGLVYSLLAFLLYIVFLGIATMNNYSSKELQLAEQERQLAEKNRELAEKERELTERRIASMMSQIRSHFIFNVLTTISGYCKIDPKKADNALIRFSRYLRKNIRIIEEEGLIDFDVELEQLEDYIALEQLRFEDRIRFEKEIGTSSFQLPPLTIQPIVENAIKHGLIGAGRSGTICLHTKRTTDCVEITVMDDGIGFVPEQCGSEESVGIRNVRYRLENMVGGSLSIKSTFGEGTKVMIKIPVEEEKN